MSGDPLYRKEMLRLAADATGAGSLPAPDGAGTAHNPACGDRVTVAVTLAGGRVTALAHQTQACVLAQASAALLAGQAPGKTPEDVAALADAVGAWLAREGAAPAGYAVFEGVLTHAGRHTCVLLPLKAARAALEQAQERGAGAQGQADSVQPG